MLKFLSFQMHEIVIINHCIYQMLRKVNTTFFGVAIKGFDTVAYHKEGRAVKGKSKFSHEWNDAKWYFSNAKNRDLFAAEPERFAPQFIISRKGFQDPRSQGTEGSLKLHDHSNSFGDDPQIKVVIQWAKYS